MAQMSPRAGDADWEGVKVLASVAGHHACTWVGPDGLPGEGEFFTGDLYGLAAATLSVLANIIATVVIGLTAWCVVQTLPS